jgi:ribosomal protein L21
MSQILTPLEEVDHILMARADHDMEVNKPIPDGVQLSGTLQEAKRNKLTISSGFPNGEVHMKSGHGFPDTLPYVWSM